MSLRVWLPLNGDLKNQGVSDVTITPGSGVAIQTDGKIGKCYRPATITLTNLNDFSFNNSSFCFWAKTNATSSWQLIIGIDNNNLSQIHGIYVADTTRYKLEYNPSLNIYGAEIAQWHHYAFIIQSGKSQAYCDGVLKATSEEAVTDDIIGRLRLGVGTAISLNDVRIYDHALSAAEVREIAQGLVLHYKLDNSGLSHSANIVGFSRYSQNLNGSTWGAHRTYNTQLDLDDSAPVPWKKGNKMEITYDTSLGSGGGASCSLGRFAVEPSTTYCYSLYVQAPDDMAYIHANWLYRYEYPGAVNESAGTKITEVGVAAKARAISLGNHWYRLWGTFTSNANTHSITFSFYTYPSKTITYYISCPQVEKGNFMAEWTGNTEEGLEIEDSSGYGHNGSILGTATLSSDTAHYNSSITLPSGANAINCGRGGMMTDSITVNIWLKSTGWGNPVSCTEGGGWNFEADGDYFRFPVYISGVGYKYGKSTHTRAQICNGQWHMLTGIYDRINQKVQIYVDGQLDNDYAAGTSNNIGYNGSNVIWIGAEASSSATAYASRQMVGSFSDFRIYCTALNADAIRQLYEVGAKIDNKQNLHAFELVEPATKISINKQGQILCNELEETSATKFFKTNQIIETNEIIEL